MSCNRHVLTLALALAPSLALGYQAPFLTTADMEMYVTDTRGVVRADGGPALFYYPNIREVRVEGRALPGVPAGRDLIRVRIEAGTHEVEVAAASGPRADGARPAPARMIRTADEFNARALAAEPGDVLVIENDVYSDWRMDIPCKGAETAPIIVRPQTPGGVMFRGMTRLTIRGEHVIVREFLFEHCHYPGGAVIFQDARACRLTQCQFFRCGSLKSTFAHLVTLRRNAAHCRVDHCYFTGSWCMSVGLRVDNKHPETAPRYNRLDHNIFRDIARIWFNGQENLQIGSNDWVTSLHTLVEHNLFDNAVGDSEIFSNKSQENVYRYNVAVNCRGCAFQLRGAQGCRVEGNVSINCAGGVVVQDKNHVIVNDLVLGCSGPGITIRTGSPGWDTPTHCLIAHNTLVGNLGGIVSVGNAWRPELLARHNTIRNNLITSSNGALILLPCSADTTIDGNLLFATGRADAGENGTRAILADPLLVGDGAGIRPGPNSPAVGGAAAIASVRLDRWARTRGPAPSIGADESGAAGPPRVRLPAIPEERKWSFGLFKAECLLAYDPQQPLAGWAPTSATKPSEGVIELVDASLDCARRVPDDFVMEWEYQPHSFASKAAVVFAAGAGPEGYRLSWGGAHEDDGKPVGRMRLEKGGGRAGS